MVKPADLAAEVGVRAEPVQNAWARDLPEPSAGTPSAGTAAVSNNRASQSLASAVSESIVIAPCDQELGGSRVSAADEVSVSCGQEEPSFDLADHGTVAWIARDGEVLREASSYPELVGSAAYAVRMAELVGGLLALGSFVALECRDAQCSRFAYEDGQGGTVSSIAKNPEAADALRRRLAL